MLLQEISAAADEHAFMRQATGVDKGRVGEPEVGHLIKAGKSIVKIVALDLEHDQVMVSLPSGKEVVIKVDTLVNPEVNGDKVMWQYKK